MKKPIILITIMIIICGCNNNSITTDNNRLLAVWKENETGEKKYGFINITGEYVNLRSSYFAGYLLFLEISDINEFPTCFLEVSIYKNF